MNAIQKAGGISQTANLKNVLLKKKLLGNNSEYKETTLNLVDLLMEGHQYNNPFLFDEDIIEIKKVDKLSNDFFEIANGNLSPQTIKVNIIGEVQDPGSYELDSNTPLIKAILQAGGTKDWLANKTNIQLFRINRNGSASLKRYKLDLRNDMSEEKIHFEKWRY